MTGALDHRTLDVSGGVPGGVPGVVPSGARSRSGADLRLVPAAVAAWAGAWWAVAEPPQVAATVGAVLLAGAAAVLVCGPSRRERRSGRGVRRSVVALAAAAGALAVLSCAGQVAVRQSGLLADLVEAGATAELTGQVRGDAHRVAASPDRPWQTEPRWSVTLVVDHVRGRGASGTADAPVLVLGGDGWEAVAAGASVRASGRLLPVEPGDNVVALVVARTAPVQVAPPDPVHRLASTLRTGLRDACERLPPDPRGLLPGLTVGDTSRLPPDLEEAMRDTGLTHLTAVSGANVSLVCGAVLLAASGAGAGRRIRLVLAAAAVLGFVVIARPDPSVLRAAVMGLVGLLGLAVARRGAGVPALAGAVVILAAGDPWLARAYGFALSVLATGALLLLAGPWARSLSRYLPRWLAYALAVPAAAQAVCGPVTVLLSPQVPLTAVPANLLVAPAVAPATVLGVVAAVVAPVWPGGAQALAWVGGWAVGWIAVVARTGAGLPHATLAWPSGLGGAALLAAATVVVVAAAAVCVRRLPGRPPGRRPPGRRPSGLRTPGPRPTIPVGVVAGGLVLVVVLGLLLWPTARSTLLPSWSGLPGRAGPAAWPPPGWRLVACDVGQGDAVVVRTGPAAALLVDTGPDPAVVDDCLRRLEVRQLELIVLTHFHADHVDGLSGALGGRPAAAALVSPLAEPAEAARASTELLERAGVTVTAGWAGQGGRVGDVVWSALWPQRLPTLAGESDGEGSGPNDASVVLHVRTPELSALLTGDLEPAGQQALLSLLRATPGATPVDVVKVAHHGSRHQETGLYEAAAARLALVSVGAGNDYGHPAASALELVRATGAVVARTDVSGDLAVGSGPSGLWVAGRTAEPAAEAGAAQPSARAPGLRAHPLAHGRRGVAVSPRGSAPLPAQYVVPAQHLVPGRTTARCGGLAARWPRPRRARHRAGVAARRPCGREDPRPRARGPPRGRGE